MVFYKKKKEEKKMLPVRSVMLKINVNFTLIFCNPLYFHRTSYSIKIFFGFYPSEIDWMVKKNGCYIANLNHTEYKFTKSMPKGYLAIG